MLEQFKFKEALQAPDFRMQTFEQLQKDLERAQCAFTLDENNFMNDLADLLESLTEQKRAQLLYLIDLPEHNTSITPTSNFFRDLAEQIIHREALKVFLRNKFSSQ
ncbi:MAG: hypothetical protein ACK5A8_09175 [Flavobacteriia bacterium]